MNARDTESQMLARCAEVAQGAVAPARDREEANVFRLAAMVLRSSLPRESANLMDASDRYLSHHPADRVDPADVVRNGWVVSLPRLRDMLGVQLRRSRTVGQ
ncbi:hypothetical protein R70006_05038 [Paraburkholderia domus]|nr:hypothetical protein [Burkholderia sp. R-70006]CAE6795169.1 hypothetical protein R70006_05038 [Paraburkholderia domus]